MGPSPAAQPPRRWWKLSDYSIASRIALLVVVGVGTALVIGFVGLRSLLTADAEAEHLVTQHAQPAIALGETRESFARVRSRLAQAASYDNQKDIDKALEKLQGYMDASTDGFEAYAGSDLTDQERSAVTDDLLPAVENAFSIINGQLRPLIDHPMSAAERSQYTKVFNGDLRAAVDAAQSALDTVVDQSLAGMERAVAEGEAASRKARNTVIVVTIIGGLLMALLGFSFVRAVRRPLRDVERAVQAIGEDDLTVEVSVDNRDELGRMASGLNRARLRLRETIMAISGSAGQLTQSAVALSTVSDQVAGAAQETSAQAGVAARAAEEVSSNVSTVAAATEEMSASIGEISHSSADALRVAEQAVTEARHVNDTVAKLGASSAEIGDVIKVITSIADQTNLLALNATIEAARAGEAGKGFAVVAEEVKNLAHETAQATDDIAGRVRAIQHDTEAAVEAINEISSIIEQINGYQSTIAAAVEEQSATTAEMARNVNDAANGATTIARTIESVAAAASTADGGVTQTQGAASQLASLSEQLSQLVARFRV